MLAWRQHDRRRRPAHPAGGPVRRQRRRRPAHQRRELPRLPALPRARRPAEDGLQRHPGHAQGNDRPRPARGDGGRPVQADRGLQLPFQFPGAEEVARHAGDRAARSGTGAPDPAPEHPQGRRPPRGGGAVPRIPRLGRRAGGAGRARADAVLHLRAGVGAQRADQGKAGVGARLGQFPEAAALGAADPQGVGIPDRPGQGEEVSVGADARTEELGDTTLEPWKRDHSRFPDTVKRLVYQNMEEERAASLPHVLDQLPMKPTVQGMDSPHQNGDHVAYEMLTRGPHYLLTSHFTSISPGAPVRGVHRHISAPTLFCLEGRGWERNDEVLYDFEEYDLLIVPPYTVHQHGGDDALRAVIYVPETGRVHHLMGLTWREQHKLSEKPTFPEGTRPLYEGDKLVGYRILRGVLGIEEDLDVMLGAEPRREETFKARRESRPWTGPVANTYDRYLKLMCDEADLCRTVDHVVRSRAQDWELTPHGRLKWLVHPGHFHGLQAEVDLHAGDPG